MAATARAEGAPLRILTFDLEDWFHILDNAATRSEREWRRFPSRLQRNTEVLLDLLASTGVRATFFCLGWVAERHPALVKSIYAAGHEIGSHSYAHQLVFGQTTEEFREDLLRSLRVIEDLVGARVRAFRAPGFSLTRETPWAFDVLHESGVEMDASVFPAPRAHGGFPGFGPARPSLIRHGGASVREFPISCWEAAGLRLAFSGGGYFRLLPYWFIRRSTARASYVMTYFHPRDFDPGQPLIPGLSRYRRLKSYCGLRTSLQKLRRYLADFAFTDLSGAAARIDWRRQPGVQL